MLDYAKNAKIVTQIVNKKAFLVYFLGSLGLMLCAQPDLSLLACLLASFCGYALFWKANSFLESKKQRFFLSCFWFALVSFGHLSWFTADRYVGWYIYIFLSILVFILGACFGGLSLLVPKPEKVTISKALQIASLWTVFEWARLFFMSGFSWDPIGLMMTASIYSLQLASLVGIFGLTFWILLTNMMIYKLFTHKTSSHFLACILLVLGPYIYGAGKIFHHETLLKSHETLDALLIQTSLYPEEKVAYPGIEKKMIPLYEQWERIFDHLIKHQNKDIDLVVLSEAAVPYGTFLPIYPQKEVSYLLKQVFSANPYTNREEFVGNAYFAQNLSQIFDADFVIGFEDGQWAQEKFEVYNAAFLFHPDKAIADRYEKRVLVPLGEYIPFSFCKKFLSRYGISDSFTPGSEAKVFVGKKVPVGLSICYEETYGHLMRQNRMKGAQLLVNLTNDVWYPHSRLPIVHFHHGKVRAVEGGVPLLRSGNTGVTCAVDSLGRIVDMLPYEKKGVDSPNAALHVKLSTYCYPTLYAKFGDITIIGLSLICLLVTGLLTLYLRQIREIGIEQN